jgi:hypothetical protein
VSTVAEALQPVHCRGCGQEVGIAPSDFRVYCDDLCAADFPISAHEDRDSLLETLYGERPTPTKTELAKAFGVTRQRITQILGAREDWKWPRRDKASA